MARRFLVLQHTPWEKPGRVLGRCAAQHGITLKTVAVWRQAIPDLRRYDGLIVLGGSPNVDQEDIYPFLAEEKEAIRRALALDLPCLGFCLGHQLLAHVLGGRVGDNLQPCAGFSVGYLTTDGRQHPAFAALPREFPMFKWHAQAVLAPLPKEFVVLATSRQCEVEAFSLDGRPHVVGMQFDNHCAAPDEVMVFLREDQHWFATVTHGRSSPAAIEQDARRWAATIDGLFARFFAGFVDRCCPNSPLKNGLGAAQGRGAEFRRL